MVVVDNLLYILDTEVRSCFVKQFELLEQSEFEFEIYPGLFLVSQDVLSLWDLHFLVMIHCWPELAVHDFQLTAECGSPSMVAYVSLFYNVL